MKTLVTHNGKFHADDIFACAIIQLHLDKQNETYMLVRTRDAEIIAKGDYVFDVGGEYNAPLNRFDHHQFGGAGVRSNEIPYASAGLVWKQFGEYIAGDKATAEKMDMLVIQPIDADDNGMSLVESKHGTAPFRIQEVLYAFRSTWKEDEILNNKNFLESVDMVKKLLMRLISVIQDNAEAETYIHEAYSNSKDKRLIVLDNYLPFETILPMYPEPLYAVRPRDDGNWGVSAVRNSYVSFENRKDLPNKWAGLRDAALQEITGVPDAVFCHNGRFLCVAKSKEGAIALAQKALEQ